MILTATVLALILLSAFFSSAETVFFSLTGAQRANIRKRSPRSDAMISRCLDDKAILFSTLLVGNTFVNFAIASIGYRIFLRWVPSLSWLSVPAVTLLVLVFGEIAP